MLVKHVKLRRKDCPLLHQNVEFGPVHKCVRLVDFETLQKEHLLVHIAPRVLCNLGKFFSTERQRARRGPPVELNVSSEKELSATDSSKPAGPSLLARCAEKGKGIFQKVK